MRVDILCPAGAVSGGPEALHQLCGALRARNVDAALVYYGAADKAAIPPAYTAYDAAVRPTAEDRPDSMIIVPEVATSLVWRFTQARRAIWWLSVDNYFKWKHLNPGPSVLAPMTDLLHLCQSAYARAFLGQAGATPVMMLTDYLTPGVFVSAPPEGRIAAVAYNPKKAPPATQRLTGVPGRRWVALEGMAKADVAATLQRMRVYVDFGPHPGRDRLPREAAASGAVVITGRRGAAGFAADVPLPDTFRLDDQATDFDDQAFALIDRLLTSDAVFCDAWTAQAPYRAWIAGNRSAFGAEVDALVAALAATMGGVPGSCPELPAPA